MKIALVGGGIAGLTAGYRLSQAGHQVAIFEKEDYLGGLAAGFKRKNWSWPLERFFHHFFLSDHSARRLLGELGLAEKLFYLRPKTSIFKNGQISQFDSPLSVLQFPHLSFPEKLRTGLVTFYLKTLKTPRTVAGRSGTEAMTPPRWKNWKFEKTTASQWLKKAYGRRAYQVLWQPLLKNKFGQYAEQISMAWFWARIKKRSSRLGYLEGGLQVLIDKLEEKIRENQGKIHLNYEVEDLNDLSGFGRVIITIPTTQFLKMKSLPAGYQKDLGQLKFIGVVVLILILKEKFLQDNTYWLNINQEEFPFVTVVEQTNFVDRKHYAGEHILYVGGYYPSNHRYFKMNKKEIYQEFLPYLQKINPKFNHLSSVICHLSSDLYAQSIISVNYPEIMPKMKTPLKNVYLANQSLVYPWDRGVNYAIEIGERAAERI